MGYLNTDHLVKSALSKVNQLLWLSKSKCFCLYLKRKTTLLFILWQYMGYMPGHCAEFTWYWWCVVIINWVSDLKSYTIIHVNTDCKVYNNVYFKQKILMTHNGLYFSPKLPKEMNFFGQFPPNNCFIQTLPGNHILMLFILVKRQIYQNEAYLMTFCWTWRTYLKNEKLNDKCNVLCALNILMITIWHIQAGSKMYMETLTIYILETKHKVSAKSHNFTKFDKNWWPIPPKHPYQLIFWKDFIAEWLRWYLNMFFPASCWIYKNNKTRL